MTKIKKLFIDNKKQYLIFAIISIILVTCTGILYKFNPLSFRSYFGDLNPIFFIIIIVVLGFGFLTLHISQEWSKIYDRSREKGRFYISSILLGISPVIIDLFFRFPEDMNKYFPESLLFYPVMALVVEIIFHLIPLSLMLLLFRFLFKNMDQRNSYLLGIILTSFLEPIFQLILGTSPYSPIWVLISMASYLYLFNFLQLYTLKQCDFLAMYMDRIFFYLVWHLIWGYVRLIILF